MKRTFLILTAVAGLSLFTLFAQGGDEKGGGEPADWMVDFPEAKALAAEEGKPMLLDFTGSDWCGWCIKLKKEVFSKAAFKDYADEELILVELDFPRDKPQSPEVKEQNQALAEKYGIRGFPTIVLLSPEGDLIGKTGYRRGGAEAYVEHLKELLGSGS